MYTYIYIYIYSNIYAHNNAHDPPEKGFQALFKEAGGREGWVHMAGCQNYGPFLGTLNIRGRIIIGAQKGTIILITTHI